MKITQLTLLLVLSIISLSSCKKDWLCTCTFGTTGIETQQLSDAKRKTAKNACHDMESELVLRGFENVNCKISTKK